MHTPIEVEEGGIECERWFCYERLPTRHDCKVHTKTCFWKCTEPGCTEAGLLWNRVFINLVTSNIFYIGKKKPKKLFSQNGSLSSCLTL